jgi:hypothetical protein
MTAEEQRIIKSYVKSDMLMALSFLIVGIILVVSIPPFISYLFEDTVSVEGYYILIILVGILTFGPLWEGYGHKKDLKSGFVEEINGIVKGMNRGAHLFRFAERIYIDDEYTDLYPTIRYDYPPGKRVEMLIRPVTRRAFKITVNGKNILNEYTRHGIKDG